jgi:hypothetical protein
MVVSAAMPRAIGRCQHRRANHEDAALRQLPAALAAAGISLQE